MTEPAPPRFPKPKILLIDLPAGAEAGLIAGGFNVHTGTFGCPFAVPKGDGANQVISNASLPNHTEQEVVVIDLTQPAVVRPKPGPPLQNGEEGWFAQGGVGVIDPRPLVMVSAQKAFDRILDSGGVFVVFAAPRLTQKYCWGTIRYQTLEPEHERAFSNWDFLPLFSSSCLRVTADQGTELHSLAGDGVLGRFLRDHLDGAECAASLVPLFNYNPAGNGATFLPLVGNKHGGVVGGAVVWSERPGRVYILPQLPDKARAVSDLIRQVLPELWPNLFPYFVGSGWVHGGDYEHPSVLERQEAQEQVRKQAEAEIARLEAEIEVERDRFGFLHTLLTGTGEELVAAAKAALEFVGFDKVVSVDDGESGNLQEDLQVHDRSPTLLFEIKGIAGQPTEGDTQQVTKYVLRRIKQWSRTDVAGVVLVNAQRHRPALDREHRNAFTAPQVTDAEANETGLMTTWDLFRLIRGMVRWKWPPKAVQDLFYHQGRLPCVPSHYRRVGVVAHFYTKQSVLSVEVEDSELRVGDVVGFAFPDGFVEETVSSLQVDRKGVAVVVAGQRTGVKTSLQRGDVPVGTEVYVVRSASTK